MKPAAFEYHAPTRLSDALALSAQFGEDARPLAGGQSLVPLMNFRLARPAHLIDLNGVGELDFLEITSGELRIGAMTRQRQLERSSDVRRGWPLLCAATEYIGHVQIRNRGTVGGSLAHAFPNAELPVALVTLGANLVSRTTTGQRTVRAEDFFLSEMATVLEPGELLSEIRVPAMPANTGWSFRELSRRYGDFALAGAAALITLDEGGNIDGARLTLTGATPIRAIRAETALLREKPSETLFRAVARLAAKGLDQNSDLHASAAYRCRASEVLARRALTEATQRASGSDKEVSS